MKQAEILPAVMAGHKLVVGQFRDWETKEIPGKGGKPSNVIVSTFVLCGREVVEVTHFAERGVARSSITRPAYKAGDAVVINFKDWQNTNWGLRASGEVQPLVA